MDGIDKLDAGFHGNRDLYFWFFPNEYILFAFRVN